MSVASRRPGEAAPAARQAWPRPARTAGGVIATAAAGAAIAAWGERIAPPVVLGLLAAAVPAAAIIERRCATRAGGRRRLLSPLTFFVLAFVAILGLRALTLESGGTGRYFWLDPAGRTESVLASSAPLARSGARVANALRNPSAERTLDGWDAPASDGRAVGARRFEASLARQSRDVLVGGAAVESLFRTGLGGHYVAFAVAGPGAGQGLIRPGRAIYVSLGVKPIAALPPGAYAELAVRFRDARDRYVADLPVAGRGGTLWAARVDPRRWHRLDGTATAPPGAAGADLLLLLRGLDDFSAYGISLDAAMLVSPLRRGVSSVAYFDGGSPGSPWRHAFEKALAIALGTLIVVVAGFLLPIGARAADRIPPLRLPSPDERRTRLSLCALLAAGVVGFYLEMRTYGGYGGYLRSLHALGVAGLGKWYLHAMATLPAGAAVLLLARRVSDGLTARPRLLELLVVVTGLGIALAYFMKATVAIPGLTLLLFAYLVHRRAVIGLWLAGIALAVLTPFVYLVRGAGRIELHDLVTPGYWSEFAANLTSRFFHFESLMVAAPFPGHEPISQPVTDLLVSIVPRMLWPDKPLSAAARFTHEFLMPGLHSQTDIGVISFPGELWLVGGVAGVVIFGLLVGVLLRLAHGLCVRRDAGHGGLLLGAGVTAALTMLNDGWGLASIAAVNLIAATGWIILLRRGVDR